MTASSEQSTFPVSGTLGLTTCLGAKRQHSVPVSPSHLPILHRSRKNSSTSSALVPQTGLPCIGEISSGVFG